MPFISREHPKKFVEGKNTKMVVLKFSTKCLTDEHSKEIDDFLVNYHDPSIIFKCRGVSSGRGCAVVIFNSLVDAANFLSSSIPIP